MLEVNEKDRNQKGNEDEVLQKRKKKRKGETRGRVTKKGKEKEDPGQCFHQRISKRDGRGAMPTPSFQQKITQEGNIVIPFY